MVRLIHVILKRHSYEKLIDLSISVVKHRMPSPTREAGDGMEASREATPKSSPSAAEESVKLIRLPKTNISLSKLPPILDDKVKLPVTEPRSPLVPVSLISRNFWAQFFFNFFSSCKPLSKVRNHSKESNKAKNRDLFLTNLTKQQ